MNPAPSLGPLVVAGVVLGIGLGGFVDGILFHQLLQWHAMLSAWRPPVTLLDKQVNTFWDGLFHCATWLTTVAGIALLWRATGRARVPRSGGALVGANLVGWGLFNIVEGVIDHHLLDVHNVVEVSGYTMPWNVGFLLVSVLLVAAGWALIQRGERQVAPRALRPAIPTPAAPTLARR